ncbi:ferrous iron transport protein B [Methanococcus aeolicus]|uniref:ferrous iron transport protein B n=1 Tax=Methanococcus aeolicus TaxID=42879 RepID=UPI0021C7B71B|nr:ferrous iron transport protein B [Methanococcus aeolicus]UXM85047.1 ferrous iron transport protein B [Methanococcus aeolicus]
MKHEICLIGNPNTGKSTVFNALTGLNAHVGNWPGVTVEKKEGKVEHGNFTYNVVDLPGVYGLTANSLDEKVSREYILNENPDIVVNIVDASNLERNLYLTTQLLEMGANVVIALNKMDLAKEMGYEIDVEKLEELLKVPVVPVVATKKEGMDNLKDTIIKSTNKQSIELMYPHLEPYVLQIMNILREDNNKNQSHSEISKYNLKYLAIKLIENDEYVHDIVKNSAIYPKLKPILEEVIRELTDKYENSELAMAEERYNIISSIAHKVITKKGEELTYQKMLDEVFTHKYLGIPILISFLWMAFQITLNVSAPFMDIIDMFFNNFLANIVSNYIPDGLLGSFLNDGVINGLGSVMVFFPPIACMFLALGLLEDCGYMARGAFVMDRIMHMFGLQGKSVVPSIMGFGCNVPGIMATRTIEDEKDRLLTILINPLMSCPARLPVYVMFSIAFFASSQSAVIMNMYILGVALALIIAYLFRKLIFKGEPSYFIMELPPYTKPNWKIISTNTLERVRLFFKKAGTIIFGTVIFIWLLSVFGPSGYLGAEALGDGSILGKSYLSSVGHIIAPIFAPFGWDWRASVALITGLLAKEAVVGTLAMLFNAGEETLPKTLASSGVFTPLTAYAYMAFVLLSVPCVATLGAVKQEAGWKWMWFMLAYQTVIAFVVSFAIFTVGNLIL